MGIVQKIVVIGIGSVASLPGMEICSKRIFGKKPCIFTWDGEKVAAQIQKATPKSLCNALFTQAYASFLLAQRINFMGNCDESQAPEKRSLITYDGTITWSVDGTRYHFEDPIQVVWLHTLSTILGALRHKKKADDKILAEYAWTIRLFLDDCSSELLKSTLESDNKNNSDYFIKAATIGIYNTKILDNLINLGIFKNPPGGIRARYIEKMISKFPQKELLLVPPLNNQIASQKNNASPHPTQNKPARKRSNAVINGEIRTIDQP